MALEVVPYVRLVRERKEASYTLGRLMVMKDSIILFRCWGLELPWKNNEPQLSCVPTGTYPLVFEFSPSFKQHLYELKDVPNRSECKIHAANRVQQLRGCIAPGMGLGDLDHDGIPDVLSSRYALRQIHETLAGVTHTTITIE